MRNLTHNFPPVIIGNGEYARAHWPTLQSWRTWATFRFFILAMLGVVSLVLALTRGGEFIAGWSIGAATFAATVAWVQFGGGK